MRSSGTIPVRYHRFQDNHPEKGRNISEESLFDFLKQLSDLDMNIKTGKIDKNIGLEILILTYDEKKK